MCRKLTAIVIESHSIAQSILKCISVLMEEERDRETNRRTYPVREAEGFYLILKKLRDIMRSAADRGRVKTFRNKFTRVIGSEAGESDH